MKPILDKKYSRIFTYQSHKRLFEKYNIIPPLFDKERFLTLYAIFSNADLAVINKVQSEDKIYINNIKKF